MKIFLRKCAISTILFFQKYIPKTRIQIERDALIGERNLLLKERQELVDKIDRILDKDPISFTDMITKTEMAQPGISPVYTVIGSAGRTATQWITDALNCHDDVFFAHGATVKPTKDVPTDREALFLRMALEDSKFDFSDVDGFFDIIETCGDYDVYGCVHALNAAGIAEHQEKFGRQFVLMAICRHPIRRLNSFLARRMYEVRSFEFRRESFIDEYRLLNNDMIASISREYNLAELSDEDVVFIQVVQVIMDEDKRNFNYQIPIYTMERLMSTPE
tara:strand:- start:29 stop:856 length:828 start_codon:yes stop_codon:yes gene_type:complete